VVLKKSTFKENHAQTPPQAGIAVLSVRATKPPAE
jgi:hypothetical protein